MFHAELMNSHFIRPEWFWALIPLALLVLVLAFTKNKQSAWQNVCDQHLLKQLLINPGKTNSFWSLLILSLAWIFAVIALAGPSWSFIEEPVYQNLNARVIVLDLSEAMNANDIKPSRITRARYKISDLLKANTDGQVGLIAFSDEPFVVSPITQDAKTIDAMVTTLSPEIMPIDGQNIGRALMLAQSLMQQAHVNQGEILLITSGPVTASDQKVASKLAAEGYHINIIGIGSERGAPIVQEQGNFIKDDQGTIIISRLDKSGLQQLAKAGNGKYVNFTNDGQDIEALSSLSLDERLANGQQTERKAKQWQDDGYWFVFLILPLALLGFRRGWFG